MAMGLEKIERRGEASLLARPLVVISFFVAPHGGFISRCECGSSSCLVVFTRFTSTRDPWRVCPSHSTTIAHNHSFLTLIAPKTEAPQRSSLHKPFAPSLLPCLKHKPSCQTRRCASLVLWSSFSSPWRPARSFRVRLPSPPSFPFAPCLGVSASFSSLPHAAQTQNKRHEATSSPSPSFFSFSSPSFPFFFFSLHTPSLLPPVLDASALRFDSPSAFPSFTSSTTSLFNLP